MTQQDVSMRNSPSLPRAQVLVASGDAPYARTLASFLEGEGYQVERCHDVRGVLRLVAGTLLTSSSRSDSDEESDLTFGHVCPPSDACN